MILYDETEYHGRSLVVKQQNANFKNDYFDDRVESLDFYGNCLWLMYKFSDFDGRGIFIKPEADGYKDYARWDGKGNEISSARALPPLGTEAIALFQKPNYGGRMVVLYESDPHLPSIDFDDDVSSFIVTGGEWTLYQESGYKGKGFTVSGAKKYPTMPGKVGNNRISSVKKNHLPKYK